MKRGHALARMGSVPEVLVVLLVASLVALANLGVLFRYVLLFQVSGIDELQKMLLVWLAFLGGAVGVTRGAHFCVPDERSARRDVSGRTRDLHRDMAKV